MAHVSSLLADAIVGAKQLETKALTKENPRAKPRWRMREDALDAAGPVFYAAGAGAAGANMAALGGAHLLSAGEQRLRPSELTGLRAAMGVQKVPIHKGSVDSDMASYFADGPMKRGLSDIKPGVHVAENPAPSILAHELGHAANRNTRMGRIIGRMDTPARFGGPVIGGLGGAVIAAGNAKRNESSSDLAKRGAGYGAVGGLIASSPMLVEEGTASLRALRAMRDIGIRGNRFGRALATLGAAGATYATAAAGGAALGATAPVWRWEKR